MEKILVSACLLGKKCKYNGESNYNQDVVDFFEKMKEQAEAIQVCPEVMGGLTTPRIPAEIRGDSVITKDGRDVTIEYREGAKKAAELAKINQCRYAVLKERSPSCGNQQIYDGTFSGTLISADGKTAEKLKLQKIKIYGETQVQALEAILMQAFN
ncbi:MAG: DUF523 domain-containing protein [Clostridium sp.]